MVRPGYAPSPSKTADQTPPPPLMARGAPAPWRRGLNLLCRPSGAGWVNQVVSDERGGGGGRPRKPARRGDGQRIGRYPVPVDDRPGRGVRTQAGPC